MNREELLKNAKPILFNTEMVQAILEGRKTVTRRKIDRDITNFCDVDVDGTLLDYQNCDGDFIKPVDLCRYKVGDILYVRETWQINYCNDAMVPGKYAYKASPETWQYFSEEEKTIIKKWKPSIHMPKEAARIFLKVTDVRVEKLQDISKDNYELVDENGSKYPSNFYNEGSFSCGEFMDLWNSTVKKQDLDKYGWDASPWVWVIEFERVEVENE